MNWVAEAVAIVGVLTFIAGALWRGYFGVLLMVIGLGMIALGYAWLKVVRARGSDGKTPPN